MHFDSPQILTELSQATRSELDAAAFGIVRMSHDGRVLDYNAYESRLSGLSPAGVIGKHFFTEVAPCTNNFMVAERFGEPGALDESLNYVFTYKMKPTRVRLRLLKAEGSAEQFLLVITT